MCFLTFISNHLQIVNPPKDLKKPRGKKCFFVKFFGTEDQYVPACFDLMKILCLIIWIFCGRNTNSAVQLCRGLSLIYTHKKINYYCMLQLLMWVYEDCKDLSTQSCQDLSCCCEGKFLGVCHFQESRCDMSDLDFSM